MPAVLQKLMRHSTIETTLRYYADLDADDIANGLWRDWATDGIIQLLNRAEHCNEHCNRSHSATPPTTV